MQSVRRVMKAHLRNHSRVSTRQRPLRRETRLATLDRVKKGSYNRGVAGTEKCAVTPEVSAAAQLDILKCVVHVTPAGRARQRQTADVGTTGTTSQIPLTQRHTLCERPMRSRCTC